MTLKPQETVDLVTFIGEILNGKLHFLWNANLEGSERRHYAVNAVFLY